MSRPQPSPWWVPILLAFLGLTACFLTVALMPIKGAMAIFLSSQVLLANLELESWRVKPHCGLGLAWSRGLYLQVWRRLWRHV